MRMNKGWRFWLLSFWMLLGASAQAQAPAPVGGRETVTWYVTDFAPYVIVDGPQQGAGVYDQTLAALIRRLPEFRHQVREVALARVINSLKVQPDACTPMLFKTPEREAVMDFSRPFLRLVPNGLITTRQRLPLLKPYLNEHGEVRLDEALTGAKFRLGVTLTRSYSAHIDAILQRRPGTLVMVPSVDEFSSRLRKLVNQDEYDGIIGYAIELKHIGRQLQLNPQDVLFVPIAEESTLLSSRFSCSKSATGRRVLAAIDRLIDDARLQAEFEGYYRAWLDDQASSYLDRLKARQPAQ